MRRWVWFIVVACVLGVVLNVAVTWTIVIRQIGTSGVSFTHSQTQTATPWAASVPSGWPAESTQLDVFLWPNYERRVQFGVAPHASGFTMYELERRSFGWPMRGMSSLHASRIDTGSGPQTRRGVDLPGLSIGSGWVLRDRRDLSDVLPLLPRPVGFAVNSLLYGLLVFVLIVVFVLVFRPFRRAAWRAKGLCGGCGYEIGDLAVCPECGAECRRMAT